MDARGAVRPVGSKSSVSERIAYDSNVLIYLAGVDRGDGANAKIDAAREMYRHLGARCMCIAPQQALGELYTVLTRDSGDRELARRSVLKFRDEFEVAQAGGTVFADALNLATDHKLQFWDALILATAAHSGCTLLLSEDMQDGFAWQGVTVANPFVAKPNRKLARLLKD